MAGPRSPVRISCVTVRTARYAKGPGSDGPRAGRTPASRAFLRVVALSLPGLTISLLIALSANLDAETTRTGSTPNAFMLLWRNMIPESWRAESTYDIALLSARSEQGARLARDHISALRFDDEIAIIESGRGLYDRVVTVAPIIGDADVSRWIDCTEKVTADIFYYPVLVAPSGAIDRTQRSVSDSIVVPRWVPRAQGETTHGTGWLPRTPPWALSFVPDRSGEPLFWTETRPHEAPRLPEVTPRARTVQSPGSSVPILIGKPRHIPEDRSRILSDRVLASGIHGLRIHESRVYGWPLRCLVVQGVREIRWAPAPGGAPGLLTLTDSLWTSGLGASGSWTRNAKPFFEAPAIGVSATPIWPLLLSNAAIFTAVPLLTLYAPRLLRSSRRWLRARHSPTKCPTCGYPRTGLARGAACPECGGG